MPGKNSQKLETERNFLNLINGIYEKPTVNILLIVKDNVFFLKPKTRK